jgi:hypothetical protein
MPWFKVDDQLAFHRKTLLAGNAAMGLWVRAGSWCSQQLNDGCIPDDLVTSLGTRTQADRLVKAGLWRKKIDGYEFHDWDSWQPTRAEVEKRRAEGAERVRQWREDRRRRLRSVGDHDD